MQHASYLSTYQLSSHRSNVLIFITWLVFRGLISLMNGQHNCFIYFQICYALAAGIQKVGRKFRTMKDGELQESWCSKKMSSHNDKEAREDNENHVRMRLGEQGKIWLAVWEAGQVGVNYRNPGGTTNMHQTCCASRHCIIYMTNVASRWPLSSKNNLYWCVILRLQ